MQKEVNNLKINQCGLRLCKLLIAIASVLIPILAFLFTKLPFDIKFMIAAGGFFTCGIVTSSILIPKPSNQKCTNYISSIDIINDLTHNIGDINDADIVFNRLTTALNKKFNSYNCAIAKFDPTTNTSSIYSLWLSESKPIMLNEINHSELEFDIDDVTQQISNLDETNCILQPIYTQNIGLGEIRIWSNEPSQYSIGTDDNQFLITSSNIAALALANIKASSSLMTNSVRDIVTGLYNKGYLGDTIERELHRAHRSNFPIGILMIEIDRFDEIVDQYTSEAGNKVLSSVAGLLQGTFRGHDISCRYSKNVFVQVLPEATLESTLKRAEELCQWINELSVKYMGDELPAITSSIGIASYPNHAENSDEMMEAVISATFRAKQSGMDQVVVAEKVLNTD